MFREIGNFSHILLNMFQGKNFSDILFYLRRKLIKSLK
jgi:hypothetical protein